MALISKGGGKYTNIYFIIKKAFDAFFQTNFHLFFPESHFDHLKKNFFLKFGCKFTGMPNKHGQLVLTTYLMSNVTLINKFLN